VSCVFSIQDEKYNHIDESEMKKVEKSVNEVMEWMNNVMNAQAKRSLDQDPVVRTHEIRAKVKVSGASYRLHSLSLAHQCLPWTSTACLNSVLPFRTVLATSVLVGSVSLNPILPAVVCPLRETDIECTVCPAVG
jgi:hypothetical protein